MKDFLIVFGIGFIVFVLGIYFLKVERRRFSESVTTEATVVTYYEYTSSNSDMPLHTMYTMAVEYQDKSGNKIHAREQSGSSRRKYPVGTVISITYSCEKPDFFIVTGDRTRIFALYGMIIMGLLMMFGLGLAILQKS